MVPSSSCPSRMPGGAGLKWGGSTRGHELPALPASSSPGFRLPQHGAEGSTPITASNYESKRLYEGCAATSTPARPPMLGDTLLLSGTPEHRFIFTEAFLRRPASSFPAMTPKLRFYQRGEAAPTQAVFRGSRNEGTAPASHQRTSQRAWSRLNLGCNEGCRNSPQASQMSPCRPVQMSLLPTRVFLCEYLPSRVTDGVVRSLMCRWPSQALCVTNQGLPGARERESRGAATCLLLHRLLTAAQVTMKLPRHEATSEPPSTVTTQGWCTQGMVLMGMALTGMVPRNPPPPPLPPPPYPPSPLEFALAGNLLEVEVAALHAPVPSHLPDWSCQKPALLPQKYVSEVFLVCFCLAPSLFSSSPATYLLWTQINPVLLALPPPQQRCQ